MVKSFNAGSDTRLDIGSNTGGDTRADFGGDLASDDGVDLNADEIVAPENSEQNMSKHWGTRVAALGATAFATIGGFFSEDKSFDEARFLEGERIAEMQSQMEAANAASSGTEFSDNSNPPNDFTGKTPEQVAEQLANQQGYSISSNVEEQNDEHDE